MVNLTTSLQETEDNLIYNEEMLLLKDISTIMVKLLDILTKYCSLTVRGVKKLTNLS